MKFITRKDYLKYLENNIRISLREEGTNYNILERKESIYDELKIKEIDKKHDKMFRNILARKKEMVKFLNEFLKLNRKIQENQIIQYPTDFITRYYKDKHSDIIYKLKNKPVYFLVEHQSTIDPQMPLRLYEYIGEIMRKEENKGIYPIVVPIVIYTGFKKWKVPTDLAQKQYQSLNYKKYEINLKYNLITAEDYTFEELLEKKTLFSSIMIIEKSKSREEINTQMNKVIEVITNPKDKEALSEIIINIIEPMIGREKVSKMLEKINNKEELEMSPFTKTLLDLEHKAWKKGMREGKEEGKAQGIKEGIKEGIEQGIEQGILNTAKKMLKKNMQMKEIQEITGLSKEKLEKLAHNEI